MSDRLRRAAGNDDIETLLAALDEGDDPNEVVEEEGVTPLMIAAGKGHVAIIMALLANGSYAEGGDANGVTALMRAALAGQIDAIRILIEAEAPVDEVDSSGATALHYAALGGDPCAEPYTPWSKSSVIALLAHASLARTEDYFEVEPVDCAGWTPLMVAAAAGHTDVVKRLLGFGAQADFSAAYGSTPLSLAAVAGHSQVAACLEAALTGKFLF